MTATLATTLRRFSFDISTPDGEAAWKAFKAERGGLPRCHGPVLSPVWSEVADLDGQTLDLDLSNLFANQWNTMSGRRVFDFALQSDSAPHAGPMSAPRNIRRGHYLEQTDAIRSLRRNTNACGYCGHKEEAARGSVFCPRCIGSEYLKEDDLPLTRMRALDDEADRAPLTDAERAHLLPLYVEAQTKGATDRDAKRLAGLRQRIEEKAAKATEQAATERAGMLWLIDHSFAQLADQNTIFYGHTGRFCIGWRQPVGPAVLSRLLDVMTEFPGAYDIKTDEGRTLSGN